jgi:hypothetical protein
MLGEFPPLVSPLIPIASPFDTARVIDQIRKWGHHFDGKDPLQFLERIIKLQEAYRVAPEQILLWLPELLRGEPLLWYRNRRHAWVTWSDFCAEFRAQYKYQPSRINTSSVFVARPSIMNKNRTNSSRSIQTNYKLSHAAPGDFPRLTSAN